MRVRFILPILIALAGCAGSDEPDRPSADDCARMREHVIDLRLAAAGPTERIPADDLAQHRAALEAAAGAGNVARCRTTRSREEVACLLAAADVDSLRTC